MSQVLKTLKKDKNIEWKYVNGKLTPFRKGKELKIGTRPKELAGADGRDLSNAFRDILKVPSKAISRFSKNPNIKDYVKEKYSPTDKSPEANAWRELVKENKETQALNEAKLEGLRIDRRSGNNIRTATRNWSDPYMGPEYEEDEKLRKKAEAATKEYQKKKFDEEIATGRAEDSLQNRKELGISTKPGMYEWTTDQKVDESAKKLTGEFWQEPEFKSEGTSKGKNKTTKYTGTSLEKKLTKIYGKRKMKRFNQVYGKLNLSDRMKRHLLMTKAFRDM